MALKGIFPQGYRPIIIAIRVSCGLSVLVLMAVPLLVRIKYPASAIVPRPHPAITGLSHLVHTFIYLLFIVLPMLGFLTVYFKGDDWSVPAALLHHYVWRDNTLLRMLSGRKK